MASDNATKEELDMLKQAPLFMTDPLTLTKSMDDPRQISSLLSTSVEFSDIATAQGGNSIG